MSEIVNRYSVWAWYTSFLTGESSTLMVDDEEAELVERQIAWHLAFCECQ